MHTIDSCVICIHFSLPLVHLLRCYCFSMGMSSVGSTASVGTNGVIGKSDGEESDCSSSSSLMCQSSTSLSAASSMASSSTSSSAPASISSAAESEEEEDEERANQSRVSTKTTQKGTSTEQKSEILK